ncbi:hypothetical protein GF369_03540 [Candidatus Peregrinibacteria bacterium]|nr:hypothetical protein [Candidatus Peregrinibacteria bacterium]
MRSQETFEVHDHGWDVFFSSLDCNGKKTVLRCVIDIASSFKKHEHKPIHLNAVTSPLIVLEKNLGHNSIPFVLESMGVSINSDTLSLTSGSTHITDTIQRMHSMVKESELHTDECPENHLLTHSSQHFAERIRELDI